jgi:pimeloyl-ACP methyl ester carboxylesterase
MTTANRCLVRTVAGGVLCLALVGATCCGRSTPARPAGGQAAMTAARADQGTAIRPFHVHVPEADLANLRTRVRATRWPDRELVTGQAQGVQLARLQELVHYWGTGYDWRKVEARLNALAMFVTAIDGVDIQFIHVRSRHPNALPLIITHGWPGSILELLGAIGPLTDPTAHGGRAEDAFDVVLPSMPGYGFSGRPRVAGWDPDHIARAWAELMRRLGYTRYVAQGGDWGAPVTEAMGRQAPAGLLGIHLNLPATIPPDVAAVLAGGGPPPAGLSEDERAAYESVDTFNKKGRAYAVMMGLRPQTIGYTLTDSPAGLAAYMLDHDARSYETISQALEGHPAGKLTRDEFLDDVTLYWLTNSAASSARLYWENGGRSLLAAAAQRTAEIALPVAITVFPDEIYAAPRSWAEKAFPILVYFNKVDRGGHFAAWEQPELFSAELRAAFRSLR